MLEAAAVVHLQSKTSICNTVRNSLKKTWTGPFSLNH